MGIVIVAALALPFSILGIMILPIGVIVVGMAFAELRASSKNAKLINPRVLLLTAVLAIAAITIATMLATVPELALNTKKHGPNDQFVMILYIVDFVLVMWLAAASGYIGYALWLKARFGDERPEVDGN